MTNVWHVSEMTSGWLFLGLSTLICVGAFLSGLRFTRMEKNPWEGKSLLGMPVRGHDLPIQKIQMFGRLQMIFAPLFLVIVTLMVFGVFGPVNGIETIKLS